MRKNRLVMPIVKWVGGKRQLLKEIQSTLPEKVGDKNTVYCEPFFGGGAVLFDVQPERAIINDLNGDLINLYIVIRDNVDELIIELERYKNEADFFYSIRELDRDEKKYSKLSNVEKAARILYLNKTCYNGLFRVNSSGQFNTPFGNYKNPNYLNKPVLKALNKYFNSADISFYSTDYSEVLDTLTSGDFVYLDPPYDPISDTSNFTGYNKGGFGREEQLRLKECCDNLNAKGVKFLLSNSATDFIVELYSDYNIQYVKAKRSINSVASKRGEIEEVLVSNYE